MEESELEEGEACSYNLTNDFGSSFDPDNDLSYIDHKLQNILGHFQKDFEGDFSAENLGAKFGGYGSFLPTYQRSPLWSYPKAPAKPQSSAGTRSPNILPGESQSGNAASSTVPKKAKSELASSRIPKKSMKSKKPNSSSRHESATEKPGVFSKQNSLKLRIKMGADSLPAEKNAAAIYSGLGLDVSPNSVSGSEAMSGEPQGYSPLESPANILNVMTSLPVDPCQLLSPLSNDLIRFIEREKPEKGYKRTSPSRLFIESSSAMANRLEPQKGGEDPSVEKKRKMLERNNLSADTNVRSKKGLLDGNDGSVKKPTETNTSYPSATEKETASSKLFDASKETASSKLLDASKENYNGSLKGEMEVGEYKGSKALEPPHHENPKTSSAGSVRGDKKTRFGDDDASGRSRKEYKGSQAPELAKKETEASKLKSGHKEHSSRKQKSDQTEREPQSSSKFSKQKSSVVNETKMNGQAEKKELAALKPHNGGKKAEDTYKDFFGDMEDSEEEEEPPTLEDTPEKSRVPVTESQNVGPGPSVGKLGSDPSLPKANPVVIEEHWVACDKCGQWRLLPFGPVPKLPEKWMCTMLDWLPGANYCDVPEDETTKAVYAMYQIPAPDSQAPVQSGLKPQFNQGEDNTKKKRKGFKKLDNGMVKEGSRTAETSKKSILTSARNGTMHNSHGLSDFADEERQKHKQKERGKAVDHHSDHDSRSLKMNNKRNAERESSMLAKKMKIESFLFPDEGGASDSGVPVASADKKHKPRVSSKMPKEEGGGASDTGNSNSTGGSKKRKLKESHGSPRVYREKENHERKKARVLKEGKEPSFSHGSGKSEKKNKSHSRREYGHVAATSSSSHKPRNSSHEVKSSPVESVSSSPMRKKKVESHDTDFLAASSMRRFSDGEGDGGSDRSQTRRKNKHGSRESPVLDVCDNKGSLKAKVRAEPSLDANLENGGHKDHIHRRSNDSLAKKSGKGSSSRDGPRHIEKKINDGSSPDMVVKPNIPKPYDVERVSERSNRADLTSPARPPSRGDSSRKKVEKCGTSAGNNSIQADDVTKATAQVRRRNEPSPSPLRKEVTSVQAAHGILKEAKDLKHTADRLKSSISNLEFIELYFQACLKFLHGAFLLETSSNESARQGETMIHSTSIYSSTANLCGFCAREYEKSKEMGAAALAYKCMEAGYMRVLNSSYTSANRYRNELQTSLQIVPPGESPSSSASDVDNVNNPAAVDRVGNSRCTSSPLVAGNHVISAQNRSNILRIIQFAQNVNLAMDASRKSRVALAASIENLGEDQQQGEGVLSIKSTLDYNFQDLEGLLRLVKLAMQANNR